MTEDRQDKALLPAGLHDVLPPEADHEAQLINGLMETFTANGYERVRPPLVEFETTLLGASGPEMAEHIFRTSLIGYTLAQLDEEADAGRVVLLCLFHDIPEARTGDLNYVNKKYVKVDERQAVRVSFVED